MKKFSSSIIVLIFLLMSASVHAQLKKPGFLLGGNVQYAMPKGNFSDTHKFGIGTEAFGGVGLGKTFLVASIGVGTYRAKEDFGHVTYTPIKAGIRQFIIGKQLFVNADLGVATIKQKDFSEKRFTRGIGVGVRLLGLEGSLNYNGWRNVNTSGYSNNVVIKVGTSIVL